VRCHLFAFGAAQIESGKLELTYEEFDLRALLQGAVLLFVNDAAGISSNTPALARLALGDSVHSQRRWTLWPAAPCPAGLRYRPA
jgi:hypothetical protein